MTIDEFWNIVERVHAAAPNDMPAKCRLLEQELHRLSAYEVLSWAKHLWTHWDRANTWDIWGAAYIIHGGCSNDSFMDFRFTLVSLGRRPYEAALANADSLADFDIHPSWACYEGYQYVGSDLCKNLHGPFEPVEILHQTKGEPFDEEEMTPRFPRLVAKYNYKDTAPEILKEARRKRTDFETMTEHVRNILLHGIIPKSGLVPPPRIVKQILVTGKSPKPSGLTHAWEPFALDEGNFWTALLRLEKPCPGDLDARPELHGKRITLDTGCGEINDYEQWINSLKDRGLL